jgi:NAD(P)-dependent dehydrogenase (short-subunit alcohol dehydrogenase family)
VIDARDPRALGEAAGQLGGDVTAIAGDVADESHRRRLAEAVGGRLDALVNNASVLGPSPQPRLAGYPLDVLDHVYRVNALAPLALTQLLIEPLRAARGVVLNVTSDAAVEAYEGWGGYGSSKAALEQLTNVLAAEEPELRVYRIDPGDMNTQMHQEAFPGEDISDRPPPERVVPALVALLTGDHPSGRYVASELTGVP